MLLNCFLKNFNQFTSSRILCVIIVYRFCFPHYFTMYSIIDRDSSCPVGRLSQGKLKSKVEVEKLKSFLEKLEHPKQAFLFKMQMIVTVGVILFGFALGVLQKWIDGSPSNIFPLLIQQLDLRNYFGRFAIWILLATCISIYSKIAFEGFQSTPSCSLSVCWQAIISTVIMS